MPDQIRKRRPKKPPKPDTLSDWYVIIVKKPFVALSYNYIYFVIFTYNHSDAEFEGWAEQFQLKLRLFADKLQRKRKPFISFGLQIKLLPTDDISLEDSIVDEIHFRRLRKKIKVS